jgi:hypothetical protein
MFNAQSPGTYLIEALVKTDEPASMNVKIGENTLETEIPSTQGGFRSINLGELDISDTGNLILEISPLPEQWLDVELAQIELIRK